MEGLGIGRIVHFIDERGETSAAIVTKVWNQETGCVNLTVFPDSAEFPVTRETSRLFSEAREPNTWRWPPRD
jgi:hypothetical protein